MKILPDVGTFINQKAPSPSPVLNPFRLKVADAVPATLATLPPTESVFFGLHPSPTKQQVVFQPRLFRCKVGFCWVLRTLPTFFFVPCSSFGWVWGGTWWWGDPDPEANRSQWWEGEAYGATYTVTAAATHGGFVVTLLIHAGSRKKTSPISIQNCQGYSMFFLEETSRDASDFIRKVREITFSRENQCGSFQKRDLGGRSACIVYHLSLIPFHPTCLS